MGNFDKFDDSLAIYEKFYLSNFQYYTGRIKLIYQNFSYRKSSLKSLQLLHKIFSVFAQLSKILYTLLKLALLK